MLEDVVILKHDGAPLKTCTRSNADMMLGLGIARLYQAEGDGPMKIILKVDPDQAEAPVVAQKHAQDARHAGVEMSVALLQSDGQFLKKITKDSAAWLLRVGVARVHNAEPYTLIMKSPPAAAQTVVSKTPPENLSTGEAKEPTHQRPRNRLYPVKLFWPNYTATKETV